MNDCPILIHLIFPFPDFLMTIASHFWSVRASIYFWDLNMLHYVFKIILIIENLGRVKWRIIWSRLDPFKERSDSGEQSWTLNPINVMINSAKQKRIFNQFAKFVPRNNPSQMPLIIRRNLDKQRTPCVTKTSKDSLNSISSAYCWTGH